MELTRPTKVILLPTGGIAAEARRELGIPALDAGWQAVAMWGADPLIAKLRGMPLDEAVNVVRYARTVGLPLVWETLPLVPSAVIDKLLGPAYGLILHDVIAGHEEHVNMAQVIQKGPDYPDLRDLRGVSWAVGVTGETFNLMDPTGVVDGLQYARDRDQLWVHNSRESVDEFLHKHEFFGTLGF